MPGWSTVAPARPLLSDAGARTAFALCQALSASTRSAKPQTVYPVSQTVPAPQGPAAQGPAIPRRISASCLQPAPPAAPATRTTPATPARAVAEPRARPVTPRARSAVLASATEPARRGSYARWGRASSRSQGRTAASRCAFLRRIRSATPPVGQASPTRTGNSERVLQKGSPRVASTIKHA